MLTDGALGFMLFFWFCYEASSSLLQSNQLISYMHVFLSVILNLRLSFVQPNSPPSPPHPSCTENLNQIFKSITTSVQSCRSCYVSSLELLNGQLFGSINYYFWILSNDFSSMIFTLLHTQEPKNRLQLHFTKASPSDCHPIHTGTSWMSYFGLVQLARATGQKCSC